MGDAGEIASAVTSVSNLIEGILDRADRDQPDNELHENLTTIQNAFANNTLDSDEFRLFIDELCNLASSPLTPTGDAAIGRRELLHALLINTTKLIYERRLAARAIAKLTSK